MSREQEASIKTKGDGDTIFPIVDQINHGVPSQITQEILSDVIELNFNSGSRAFDRSDYETAQSYLDTAFTLLGLEIPKKHWNTHYEFSLRLFMLSAKIAYSCGNMQKAHNQLNKVLKVARCLEDKLDAYFLRVTVSLSCTMHVSTAITCEVFQTRDLIKLVPGQRFY